MSSEVTRVSHVINFDRYIDSEVRVTFSDNRECVGILKGWDHLTNIVLESAVEVHNGKTRNLGTLVCRGTAVSTVFPMKGYQEIENPFLANEEDGEAEDDEEEESTQKA